MILSRTKWRFVCPILIGILLISGSSVVASEDQEIPEELQIPIFFKLLTYDRTLLDSPEKTLRVGILYNRSNKDSERNMEAMADILSGIKEKTIKGKQFEYVIIPWDRENPIDEELRRANVDVLYVTAGHMEKLSRIKALTRSLQILSLAGVTDYVPSGLSIGLGLERGRPRIIVNLDAVQAEGHDLEAQVLRVCKMIKNDR